MRIDRLETLIEESGLSINDLARLAEVSPDYIWKVRHGKAPNVSAVVLARFAETLGVSIDYLLGIERDEKGIPVPEANLARLVARLNTFPAQSREVIVRLVETALELVEPASGSIAGGRVRILQLYDMLEPDQQEELEHLAEELQVHYRQNRSTSAQDGETNEPQPKGARPLPPRGVRPRRRKSGSG